jgi:FlaA1/EpsC-like NDP-sugar epimerase
LAIDGLIGVFAGWMALAIRLDAGLPIERFVALMPLVLLPAIVTPLVHLGTGVVLVSWHHPSSANVVRQATGTLVALGVTLAIVFVIVAPLRPLDVAAVPRSYWPLQAALAFGISLALRSRQAWLPTSRRRPLERRTRTRTILFGAGAAGAIVASEARMNRRSGIWPVAFLDDNPDLWGQVVAGLPVVGGSGMVGVAATDHAATQVLITMPSAPGEVVRRVLDAATAAGLGSKTVPALGELIAGSLDLARIRRVNVEDLLRRPVSEPDRERVRAMLVGQRVLVTGAAGSIGSEILRQVVDAGPAKLVAFDQAESALFEIENEILARIAGGDGPEPSFVAELGSVSDPARLRDLFHRHPVDIVIHAAAYKHVPMLESHAVEAVTTNVGGTMGLLLQARLAGASRFVLVSTDKAVDPTSVMGATKRLAELAVLSSGRTHAWDAVVVRFGNVLGSAGSVIPIFEAQLARGAPITITHPDATRFFMTIPEASLLVLSAAALGGPGMTYVLKMGEPVRILDLARDVIRLAGLQDGSVEIKYIGLRPGERLHESLFNQSETDRLTPDSRILKASSEDLPGDADRRLLDLIARARQRRISPAEVVALARELGRGPEPGPNEASSPAVSPPRRRPSPASVAAAGFP